MKPITSFALLCAFAAVANGAATTPVGYETLTLQSGFNYLGVRLHEPTAAAGTLESGTATSVTDTGADFSALSANASTLYLLEILDGSGVVSEFQGSDVSGDTITTVDDFSALAGGTSYSIRAASTLSSIFGASNSAGLAEGFFGPGGADVVYLPDGAGGFDTYYYDSFQASWADATTTAPVDGALVPIVYADGLLISSSGTGATSLIVTGEVKTTGTAAVLLADAFNYLSSGAPAGQTLASAFGATDPAGIDQGFFGPGGADVVYVPTVGGFNTYYYDSFQASWADANTTAPVDASTIDLPSGVLVSNTGAASPLVIGVPAFYSTL